jgi:hypothetical protein
MFYAGIGSRKTPQACLDFMTKIGRVCTKKDLILRSGGAVGADQAFERGCDLEGGQKEIWTPKSQYIVEHEWAIEKAKAVCWEYPLHKMKPYTRSLIIRNMYQIFGDDPEHIKPVKFVVFYCEGDPLMQGKLSGGTRYAVRAAHNYNIPHYNLRTHQLHFANVLKAFPDVWDEPNPF